MRIVIVLISVIILLCSSYSQIRIHISTLQSSSTAELSSGEIMLTDAAVTGELLV